LAVDRSQQGQCLGEKLLVDAVYRTVLVAEQISAIGLFVDPMTPNVIPFYQQYGFFPADPSDSSQLEMWLHIKACTEIAAAICE
ncbi:N-acetyltransferase, partial [Endozoicomonas sp. SM1973]|nr:N-acetyltransferase [Spartinivicinus marinus]